MNKFMDVVPKGVKVSAVVVMSVITVGGGVGGGLILHGGTMEHVPVTVVGVATGAAAGLVLGALIGVWLLCLGYVYADAKRRGMRPVLWMLIAALFPHLFGFLLYFALRQPMSPKCPHCGQAVTLDQRFCSWCGAAGPAVGGAAAEASGVGSVPAV